MMSYALGAVKKTKLFLHIGHGKTGTSAVQSSLAIASGKLLERGINYPIHPSLRDRSSQLEITSGNWAPNPEVSLTQELLTLANNNQNAPSIILSSESLFWDIPELIENKNVWEDRIDLHGMTLDQAHPALIGFIMRSYGEGKRLVLVITGKGKAKDEGGPIPVRLGVLKHQVPQ